MERLVTSSQAAEILGLSLQGIHYRIKKNQLKSIKKDGKIFVYINDSLQKTSKKTVQIQEELKKEHELLALKDEQIVLLKKSMKWMKKQYISEIKRLEKNQDKIIEVFNSEIKLLQSAFNEMRSVYKPQLEVQTKNQEKKDKFIALKDFFILMKKQNKTEVEIKQLILKAIKNKDYRFIYNKNDKKLLILNEDFSDLY